MPAADPRAHTAVAKAIKAGVLVRPDRCENCGDPCKPHAHHEDYSKPLEVVWLCPTCHRREPLGANGRDDTRRQFLMRLPYELFGRVEEARGDVPRQVWIQRAIEERLDGTGAEASRLVKRITRSDIRSSADARAGIRPRPKGQAK